MLYSMTGYGRAEMTFNDKTLLVEVKSLNGKQFDVRLNIPSLLKPIEVEIGSDDEAIAIVVRDKGPGLKPGESSLVFNRFWRADPARARTTGGTGLGLAIALEDARLHSGWLDAWGTPGKGTMFRLTLPRVAQTAITKSPLPLGTGEDEKLELDMSALQELFNVDTKSDK